MKQMVYFLLAIFIAGNAYAQTVEFRVNMNIKAEKGQFATTDAVKLSGNFNGWNNGIDVMTDSDNDLIYTITIDTLTVGDTIFFKFIKGADQWESDPNRELVIPEGNYVYEAWFDRDSISEVNSVDITFSCNMEFEIVSGRFNPATDTLTVRGSFNGWSGNDLMEPSVSDPNFYETTINYATSVGEVINYKYAYIITNGITWENDPNKTYEVTQDDIDAEFAFVERTFNNLTLDNVTNNPVVIKFVVDMDTAKSAITNDSFPSIDNVYIAGANFPLQWPQGGWPNEDSVLIHYLYNDGTNGDEVAGDSHWSLDLTFPQYSPLRIQYKYGANWGLASNTGGNDNESFIGTDHFIDLTSDLVSASVRNVFGVMGDHELVDIVSTGIKEISDVIPNSFNLSQNFPNPFNPVTNIQFAIPKAGLVTLKVFNLLGEEVATLINEEMNAGTFNVDFNASLLSSGIYFYSINSDNFTSTKKMILMK